MKKNAKKKSIISKYADKNHISLRKASREFPYMTAVFKNPNIHKELGLSEEEVNYISSL